MNTLKIIGEDGDINLPVESKLDNGDIKVVVPLALSATPTRDTLLNTEVMIQSNATKNAKGQLSSMVKVSVPYQAYDLDPVSEKWVPNKRRSGATVSAHIVFSVPNALVTDDAAGCDYARKQLLLTKLVLDKLLAPMASCYRAGGLDTVAFDIEAAGTRTLALPQLMPVNANMTRSGKAVFVTEGGVSTSASGQKLPTAEDTGLDRLLSGKPLIHGGSPDYRFAQISNANTELAGA